MKVMVFGANGFLGRSVSDGLSSEHEVVRITRNHQEEGETADLLVLQTVKDIVAKHNPDVLINAAGVIDPKGVVANNITYTANILEAASNLETKPKVVIFGSASEYGVVDTLPVSEDFPLNAQSAYGHAKVEEEKTALSLADKLGLTVIVARIFNPIGKGMAEKFFVTHVKKQINEYEKGLRDSIEISRKDSLRDYIAVADLVTAIGAIIAQATETNIYNIGSGVATSNGELLQLMLKNSRIREEPAIVETLDHPEPLVAGQANITKITTELGWQPRISIDEAVKEIMA